MTGDRGPRVETWDLERLRPLESNPREHSEAQVDEIAGSIRRFGFLVPIVVDEARNEILAGNGRYRAAVRLGLTQVPVVLVGHLSEADRLAFIIADNAIATHATWDRAILADYFRKIEALGIDPTVACFAREEIDEVLAEFAAPAEEPPETWVPPPSLPPMSEPGDIWALGAHRIGCLDAGEAGALERLLEGRLVDLVVTSPPYNVGKDYGDGFDDSRPVGEYLEEVRRIAARVVPQLAAGRFLVWNVGVSPQTAPHRHVVMLEDLGLRFYRQVVWRKTGVPYPTWPITRRRRRARTYTPNWTHEVVNVLQAPGGADEAVECPLCVGHGDVPARVVAPLEAHELAILMIQGDVVEGGPTDPRGRYSADVWEIHQSQASTGLQTLGVTTERKPGEHGSHKLKEHPAAYPVELPRAIMSLLTSRGESVLDPFGGSGATIIAGERMGRAVFATEIEPRFVDVAVRRWAHVTGLEAVRLRDGLRAGVEPRPQAKRRRVPRATKV